LSSIHSCFYSLNGLLSPVHTVTENGDCRRKVRLLPKTASKRRQSPKSATVWTDRLLGDDEPLRNYSLTHSLRDWEGHIAPSPSHHATYRASRGKGLYV